MALTRSITLAAGVFFAACGGGNAEAYPTEVHAPPPPAPSGPVHARGGGDVTAVIGDEGGDLTLGNGLVLEIPAGALTEPVEVTMRVGTGAQAFRNREDEQAIGQAVRITPALDAVEGKNFVLSVPFTSIPNGFSEGDAALAVERAVDGENAGVMDSLVTTRWDHWPATVSAGHMRSEVNQLGGYRVQFVVSR